MMQASLFALSALASVDAVLTEGHFVYTSEKHGSAYVNKDALYPHTKLTSDLCRLVADHFWIESIDAVIAPAVGGVILSQWIAFHLTLLTNREILAVYAEKDATGDGFVIKRGYEKLVRDKRVLAADDILNTGGSAKGVIDASRRAEAVVVGLAALVNRGGVKAEDVGNPSLLFALCDIPLEAWDEDKCPLCAKGVPININLGKGREYLARKQQR